MLFGSTRQSSKAYKTAQDNTRQRYKALQHPKPATEPCCSPSAQQLALGPSAVWRRGCRAATCTTQHWPLQHSTPDMAACCAPRAPTTRTKTLPGSPSARARRSCGCGGSRSSRSRSSRTSRSPPPAGPPLLSAGCAARWRHTLPWPRPSPAADRHAHRQLSTEPGRQLAVPQTGRAHKPRRPHADAGMPLLLLIHSWPPAFGDAGCL